MIIIGISGKKYSGKNTISKFIALQTPLRVKEMAFATALKEEVARVCGVPVAVIEENKSVFRPMLQWWANEFKREFKKDNYHWVNILGRKILDCNDADIIVVTDVRHIIDAESLIKCGAVVVRVSRPSIPVDEHSSEVELDSFDKFDFVLNNDSTLSDLAAKVRVLLTKLKIPLKTNDNIYTDRLQDSSRNGNNPTDSIDDTGIPRNRQDSRCIDIPESGGS